jgi:hypothetical protein
MYTVVASLTHFPSSFSCVLLRAASCPTRDFAMNPEKSRGEIIAGWTHPPLMLVVNPNLPIQLAFLSIMLDYDTYNTMIPD